MSLPDKEAIFDFEFVSEPTGKKYEGRFTVFCRLDMGQKHRLELEKTRLLGNYPNPTDGLAGIAVVLANLRLKISDAPDWWKQSNGGFLIEDEDALVALFDKVSAAEVEWLEKLKQKTKKTPATQTSPEESSPS